MLEWSAGRIATKGQALVSGVEQVYVVGKESYRMVVMVYLGEEAIISALC